MSLWICKIIASLHNIPLLDLVKKKHGNEAILLWIFFREFSPNRIFSYRSMNTAAKVPCAIPYLSLRISTMKFSLLRRSATYLIFLFLWMLSLSYWFCWHYSDIGFIDVESTIGLFWVACMINQAKLFFALFSSVGKLCLKESCLWCEFFSW